MNANDIRMLFDYNYWANARILNAAARLTDEQFSAPGNLSFGGVRGTLVHLFGAEYLWRKRTQERVSPSSLPPESAYPDLATLRTRWDEEERLMRAYLDGLTDEALQETFKYKNIKGLEFEMVLWRALVHVANHGTQHRAEVAVLLTDFGQSPGDVDMSLYFREKAGK
jgi:uncharacterized damage-inducible protein DinB